MRLFKKKSSGYIDQLEQRLDTISDLTRGLGRKEFNALLEALRKMYDARQNLKNVKTDEEKENEEIGRASCRERVCILV